MVTAAGRYAALQENLDGSSTELQEPIQHMNAKQNRLLATMERKQMMNGASDDKFR